jgi:hypothetical protein
MSPPKVTHSEKNGSICNYSLSQRLSMNFLNHRE